MIYAASGEDVFVHNIVVFWGKEVHHKLLKFMQLYDLVLNCPDYLINVFLI